jgi:hypothetical protein
MPLDVDRLRNELKTLVSSWEYAFAMGHGCNVDDHPNFEATRRRAADLRARIVAPSARWPRPLPDRPLVVLAPLAPERIPQRDGRAKRP